MKTVLKWWLMCAVALLYACGGGDEADPGSGHYASGVLTGLKAGNSVLISSSEPALLVSRMMVFLKSIMRPSPSSIQPLSNT